MARRRLRQSNLTGAAGLVSLEDGCINEFVQRGTKGSGDENAFLEMGERDVVVGVEGDRSRPPRFLDWLPALHGVRIKG